MRASVSSAIANPLVAVFRAPHGGHDQPLDGVPEIGDLVPAQPPLDLRELPTELVIREDVEKPTRETTARRVGSQHVLADLAHHVQELAEARGRRRQSAVRRAEEEATLVWQPAAQVTPGSGAST